MRPRRETRSETQSMHDRREGKSVYHNPYNSSHGFPHSTLHFLLPHNRKKRSHFMPFPKNYVCLDAPNELNGDLALVHHLSKFLAHQPGWALSEVELAGKFQCRIRALGLSQQPQRLSLRKKSRGGRQVGVNCEPTSARHAHRCRKLSPPAIRTLPKIILTR